MNDESLNPEQLAAQRGQAAHALMKSLAKEGYTYKPTVDESSVFLEVKHWKLPNWFKHVSVAKSSKSLPGAEFNELRIPGQFHTHDLSRRGIARVMKKLTALRLETDVIRRSNSEFHAKLDRYGKQKEAELSGVQFPAWVNVDVRVSGESAGLYRMSFDNGSPLERLTAEQVKKLAEALSSI